MESVLWLSCTEKETLYWTIYAESPSPPLYIIHVCKLSRKNIILWPPENFGSAIFETNGKVRVIK